MLSCLIALCALPAAGICDQTKKIIGPGDLLPAHPFQYAFPSPDRKYLGLSHGFFSFLSSKEFTIQDIPAEIIVIEFFNNYCTSCQAQAPVLNAAFNKIMENSALKEKVRFIGIGAGNNSREIERFRNDKQVLFPLIPDTDFGFYNAVGDPGGTPFTIITKRTSQGLTVMSSHMGLIKEPDFFVEQIQEAAMPGAAGKPLLREAKEPVPGPDRMHELRLSDSVLLEKVKASMRTVCPECPETGELSKITLSGGSTVYRGELSDGKAKTVLFSQVISRKPVCDVCHGIHFIITFTPEGIVRDFAPVHITKYGNVLWDEKDIAFMREKLVGKNLKQQLVFNPEADAVSRATISSSIIFNSVNNLQQAVEELRRRPQ